MKTSDFHFYLPESLIAQTPTSPRDHSRLLAIRRGGGMEHKHFYDLPEYLKAGDALVVNRTRVMPARLAGEREGGGACEVLLLTQLSPTRWEAIVKPGRRLHTGARMSFGGGRLRADVVGELDEGGRVLEFLCEGTFEEALHDLGEMPLPPYITETLEDRERYQTVYSKEEGSAAAPTAGLHFTPELLAKIEGMGVEIVPILLNVGLGTFRPVKTEDVDDHVMHSEYYEVSERDAERLNAVKSRGGRVIAVGTTSVRALESAAVGQGIIAPGRGQTDIFIKPGDSFRMIDGLVTNFHLPGSTLIMLVSAFLGRKETLEAYLCAVERGYRFYSFGDAMLIL